jgi:hypothetical protein
MNCARPPLRRLRRGFTLLELSIGLLVGMMVGAISLTLLNQQTSFLRIFRAQDFLTSEAPLINNYLARVIANADGYRLHGSFENAVARTSPVLAGARAITLRFKQPTGGFREVILAQHNPGAGNGLYFYLVATDGTVGQPQFPVTKRVADTVFSVEEGILRVRIAGPNGEQIVYSGAQQL